MKYFIYKTTNILNNKIYIGQHSCSCENCSYIGSGVAISKAIKKYGAQNFKKEILFEFSTFEEMNQKEVDLVNEDFILRSDTYNLKTDGSLGSRHSIKTIEKISVSKTGKIYDKNHRDAISKSLVGRKIDPEVVERTRKSNTGKKRSHQSCKNISNARKGKKPSQEASNRIRKDARETNREKLGNFDILKIDVNTDEILERYEYLQDIGLCGSNILVSIRTGKPRYGYIWKLAK